MPTDIHAMHPILRTEHTHRRCGQAHRHWGPVSMDMLCADLRAIPKPGSAAGDLVGEGLSADVVAASAGTVSYELPRRARARVPQLGID
jgi:alanine racemase